MKRTDKEIISAMEYLKSQHNGELPYKFGTFECAKMMAKYLIEQSSINVVVKSLPSNDDIYLKASEYARNVQYPLNSTKAKLRQAFKNGAMLIRNSL